MVRDEEVKARAKALVIDISYDLFAAAEVGLSKEDVASLHRLAGSEFVETLRSSHRIAVAKFNISTGYVHNNDVVDKNVKAELAAERKHQLRVIKKLATDHESAVFVWYLWVQDHDIDFRSALELCDYYGVEQVAKVYRKEESNPEIEVIFSR